jgi:membrane-associated phospholipid phosphatase
MTTDLRWLGRIWVLAVVFIAVALVKSWRIGIPFRDPHGEIFTSRLALTYGLFAVLVVVDAVISATRGPGLRRIPTTLRTRWPLRRVALALGALLAYHLVYLSYHNLKSWDVFNHPRDSMLLSWDRALFVGHSPAVLLHDLLGHHLAAYVLMVIYESFTTLTTLGLVAAMVFTPSVREGAVFVASGMWAWILGVGSYYLIPSLGPFHSAPGEFSALPHTMVQDTQVKYMAQRAYLLGHPHAPHAFAQVSAFASLHVAFITLLFLMARYYRLRRLSQFLAVFVVLTMVATVYLGWHYFVDDIAGVLIACIAVFLGRLTIYPRSRRATHREVRPAPRARVEATHPQPR